MSQDCRQARVRLLVHKLNKARKKQAKQIDLLCNDLIHAQRDFIRRLRPISFAGSFYKSLIGIYDQKKLLETADTYLHDILRDIHIVFYLKQSHRVISHTIEQAHTSLSRCEALEHSFQETLIDNLCRIQRPCGFSEMHELGLHINPEFEHQWSALVVPIIEQGNTWGLIFIYRDINQPISLLDSEYVKVVTIGLARALSSGHMITRYHEYDKTS